MIATHHGSLCLPTQSWIAHCRFWLHSVQDNRLSGFSLLSPSVSEPYRLTDSEMEVRPISETCLSQSLLDESGEVRLRCSNRLQTSVASFSDTSGGDNLLGLLSSRGDVQAPGCFRLRQCPSTTGFCGNGGQDYSKMHRRFMPEPAMYCL